MKQTLGRLSLILLGRSFSVLLATAGAVTGIAAQRRGYAALWPTRPHGADPDEGTGDYRPPCRRQR
jgi:hypothetical protein